MKPSDPRIRRQLAPARRQLTVVLVAGVLGSFLLVGAFLLGVAWWYRATEETEGSGVGGRG